MLTVGVLAALLNIAVLITVAVADRVLEQIIRNFALSRLHRTNRAPVVHDSDTWLLNIPRSLLKYHRNPAILFTVLCATFLVASEVITELGVDKSSKCNPEERHGLVITEGDSHDSYTDAEIGASAMTIQAVTFMDESMTRLPSGMPKFITGAECIPCLKKDTHPDLVSGCSVTPSHVYGAGALRVGIRTTDQAFGTICDGFEETGGKRRLLKGLGDLTGNGEKKAIFVFIDVENEAEKALIYFEYSHQNHVVSLKDKAKKVRDTNTTVWEETKAVVRTYKITCDVNVLSKNNFKLANMIYRTMRLENPARIAIYNEDYKAFEPISQEDVYRAVLSMKIMEDTSKVGTYYRYTECGVYNWRFLAPILVVMGVIMVLNFVSLIHASIVEGPLIPSNSRSWFHHATSMPSTRSGRHEPIQSGYLESIYEEMVLIPDMYGSDISRLVFLSRSPRTLQEATCDEQNHSGLTIEELFEMQEPSV